MNKHGLKAQQIDRNSTSAMSVLCALAAFALVFLMAATLASVARISMNQAEARYTGIGFPDGLNWLADMGDPIRQKLDEL